MARRRNKDDRLKNALKKISKTNIGGSGVDYWKPKEGRNVIRLFAGVGDMDSFFIPVGRHRIGGGNRPTYITCPDFTIGEECPVCEFCKGLFNLGDKDSKKLGSDLWYRKNYWMNVLVRGEEDKGPQLYTPGVMVMKQLVSLLGDPDVGELLLDDDDGLDIIVHREGIKLNTTYSIRTVRETSIMYEERNDTDDDIDARIDGWYDKCKDFTPVELTEDSSEDNELRKLEDGTLAVVTVKPYDRIKTEFEALDVEESVEEEEEDPKEEDRKERVLRSRGRRRRSRP